jgi:hypothetical protein
MLIQLCPVNNGYSFIKKKRASNKQGNLINKDKQRHTLQPSRLAGIKLTVISGPRTSRDLFFVSFLHVPASEEAGCCEKVFLVEI